MNESIVKIIFLLFIVSTPIFCFSQAPRPVSNFSLSPTDLLKTRPDSEIKDLRVTMPDDPLPLGRVLYKLAFQTGIPIGLEVNDSDDYAAFEYSPELILLPSGDRTGSVVAGDTFSWRSESIRSFSIGANQARLEDVLDELVTLMKSYRWEIKDGVVNILPKQRKSKLIEEFLETKIRNFKFANGKSIRKLMDSIYKSTELEKFSIAPAIRGRFGEDKFTLNEDVEFSNITVKELLNRLSKINMCGWIVSFEKTKDGERIWVGV